ncbi:hypothetical protein EQV77_03430 [Halobacillus fulvus]|nr:hypothetical protein EQV77_03430 [Halobacillus fulvus]
MNFVALDFETANSARDSVCSIGMVEYKDGSLHREYYRLVKPKKNYFAPINVSIHGITREDVRDAYEFHELWEEEIRPFIEGKLIIAHNAKFDMGVLRAVLDQYGLPYPMIAYNCTLNISKKTWSLPRYNLKALSDHLGISLRHHQALDDAKASAQIFIKAGETLQASTEKELVEKSQTTNGMMFESSYEPARLNKRKRAKFSNLMETAASADPSQTFYASSVSFSGKLSAMNRQQVAEVVQQNGGTIDSFVKATTNYLVIGNQTYKRYLEGVKTAEIEQAELLLSQGHSIELLTESEFFKLIG